MKKSKFPPDWDQARVRRVLEHYETQTAEEAVAEDESSFEATTHTAMEVTVDLVPAVRELIAKHERSAQPGHIRRPGRAGKSPARPKT